MCDGQGSCGTHSGDPCPGTQCSTCQETTHSCFDAAATPCSDQDACTQTDRCDGAGTCVGTNSVICTALDQCHDVGTCAPGTGICSSPMKPDTTPCDADANLCTTDQCSGGTCLFVSNVGNGGSCDDGLYCDGVDTCDGAGMCTHSGDPCLGNPQCNQVCMEATDTCFDPVGTMCNDNDPGTLADQCDGHGNCAGHTVTHNYVILKWDANKKVATTLGREDHLSGHACTDTLKLSQGMLVEGDVVGLATTSPAINGFVQGSDFLQDLVSGGGSISLLRLGTPVQPEPHGRIQAWNGQPPTPQELVECWAAVANATARRAQLMALTATTTLPAIKIKFSSAQTITLGAGVAVVDIQPDTRNTSLSIGANSKLTIVGQPGTDRVIFRINGRFSMAHRSEIRLQGLTPEQVIFVVTQSVRTGLGSVINGTLMGADSVVLGRNCVQNGQVLGDNTVRIGQKASLNDYPFKGW
jgi:hypothetical protein